MIYIAVVLTLMGCVIEVYYWSTFFKSEGGKYPPFIPSFGRSKRVVIEEVANILKKAPQNFVVADLGCGSGTLLVELAKAFPQHNFVGVEWDAVPYHMALRKLKKYPNIKIARENFMKANLAFYDVVICYVGNKLSYELGNKLNHELKRSAVVVSEIFELDCLKEERRIEVSMLRKKLNVFVYRVSQ